MGGRRLLRWAGHALGIVPVGLRPSAAYDVSSSLSRRAVVKACRPLPAGEGDLDIFGSRSLCRWESPALQLPLLPSVHEEDARRRLPRVVGRRPEAGEAA